MKFIKLNKDCYINCMLSDYLSKIIHLRGRIRNSFNSPVKHRFEEEEKIKYRNVNIFLPISLDICFGCSKEPSH